MRTVFGLTRITARIPLRRHRHVMTQVGGPAAAIFAFNEEVAPDP